MVKKFTIPFASQGDANDIPDALQVDGKVSFTQGFGYDYERPYDDPQAKDIAREDMNGLFKAITSAVGELQTLGASEWSNAISYPKGAIVYYEKDLYISQVDDNQNEPPQNWVSITSIANDSLKKAANLSDLTNKTTARSNLGLGSSATLNKTDVLGTSTNLVATQKLVNDTKINLESSKQDKLAFTGSGNVARMSEVNKKRDNTDLDVPTNKRPTYITFSGGDGDAHFGYSSSIGGAAIKSGDGYYNFRPNFNGYVATTSEVNVKRDKTDNDFYNPVKIYETGSGYSRLELHSNEEYTFLETKPGSQGFHFVTRKLEGGNTAVVNLPRKSGTLALDDTLIGIGQTWSDITNEIKIGVNYTNTSRRPIMINIGKSDQRGGVSFYVDNTYVAYLSDLNYSLMCSAIVPPGSTYRVELASSNNPGLIITAMR